MTTKKIVLLTGASSGIGYKTAELLASLDYKVYGAARRVEKWHRCQYWVLHRLKWM